MNEPELVRDLLERLLTAPLRPLGEPAPEQHGVYAIFDARGACIKVGRTTRGMGQLFKRLRKHARGRSDFGRALYNGDKARLAAHKVRWLVVDDDRQRCLLECLATGVLCPLHLGLGLEREETGAGEKDRLVVGPHNLRQSPRMALTAESKASRKAGNQRGLPGDMGVEMLAKPPRPGTDRADRYQCLVQARVRTVAESRAALKAGGWGHMVTRTLRRFDDEGYLRLRKEPRGRAI